MNTTVETIKAASSLKFGRAVLLCKKFSPEILTTVGVVGIIGAGVMVGRATLKAVPVIEQIKEDRALLEQNRDRIGDKQYSKGLTQVYTKGALDLTKIYGPSITLGLAGLSCILGAQGIMRKRNAAMAAAYKTLEEGFTKYRDRVQEELGEDQELDIYRNVQEAEIINEDGTREISKHIDPNTISGYARFFDELNPQWNKQLEYNPLFLMGVQNHLNDLLKARGHVFLNEAYEALNLPHTEAGSVVGWIMDKGGDNFIDFGLFDPTNQAAREFVNGYEAGILVDFNVDGLIYNLLNA